MRYASPLRSTRPRRTSSWCQAWPCRAAVACTACTETSRGRSSLVPSSLPKRERCCRRRCCCCSGLCRRGAGRTQVELLRFLVVGKLPRCREADEADHERARERHVVPPRVRPSYDRGAARGGKTRASRAQMLLALVLVLAGAEPVACPTRRRRGGVRRVTATRWRLLSAPTHRQAAGARSPRNHERCQVKLCQHVGVKVCQHLWRMHVAAFPLLQVSCAPTHRQAAGACSPCNHERCHVKLCQHPGVA